MVTTMSITNLLETLPVELKGTICKMIDGDINQYAWRLACGMETKCVKCLTETSENYRFFQSPDGKYHKLCCTHGLGLWAPFQEAMLASYIRERRLKNSLDKHLQHKLKRHRIN
jgi:hypothetical protein